jgi:cytoskeletal protein CcmA (bactofilin family)
MDNEQKTTIAGEVEITGTIKSVGGLRIDGKLEGELICKGDAVVGKSATIKGNLAVNSAVIEGNVQGNIVAQDKIDMKASARVQGDIKSKRLAVEDGVTFVGKSEVNPSGQAVTPPAAAAPVQGPGDGKSEAKTGAPVRK